MNVRVGKSLIHGKGCFAGRAFWRDQLIGLMTGRSARNKDHPHVLWYLDAAGKGIALRVTNDLRFVNHSTKPNCNLFFVNDRIELRARRLIRIDEELTINYSADW